VPVHATRGEKGEGLWVIMAPSAPPKKAAGNRYKILPVQIPPIDKLLITQLSPAKSRGVHMNNVWRGFKKKKEKEANKTNTGGKEEERRADRNKSRRE